MQPDRIGIARAASPIFLAPLNPSARSESARFSARSSASSARSDAPSLTGVGRSRSSAFRACDKRHDGCGKNVEPNHERPHHLIILIGELGQHEPVGRIDDDMANDHDGQNGVRAVVEPCQDYELGQNPQRIAAGSAAMSGQRSVRVDARAHKRGAKHQGGPQCAGVRLQCGSGQSEWRPHCSKATRASARVAVINSGIGTDSLGPCARPASPGP